MDKTQRFDCVYITKVMKTALTTGLELFIVIFKDLYTCNRLSAVIRRHRQYDFAQSPHIVIGKIGLSRNVSRYF